MWMISCKNEFVWIIEKKKAEGAPINGGGANVQRSAARLVRLCFLETRTHVLMFFLLLLFFARWEYVEKIMKIALVHNYERSTSNWRLSAGLSLHGSVVDVPWGRPFVILNIMMCLYASRNSIECQTELRKLLVRVPPPFDVGSHGLTSWQVWQRS